MLHGLSITEGASSFFQLSPAPDDSLTRGPEQSLAIAFSLLWKIKKKKKKGVDGKLLGDFE